MEHAPGKAFGGGNGRGAIGRAGLVERWLHRHHDFIVVSVVAAFDLHDAIASGEGPSGADGVVGGFGAGVGEAPHRQLEPVAQEFSDVGVVGTRGDKQRAPGDLLVQGLGQDRVAVTAEQGAVAHVEVDVVVPVEVDEVTGVGVGRNHRVGVVGLKRRWNTTGQGHTSTLVGLQ